MPQSDFHHHPELKWTGKIIYRLFRNLIQFISWFFHGISAICDRFDRLKIEEGIFEYYVPKITGWLVFPLQQAKCSSTMEQNRFEK